MAKHGRYNVIRKLANGGMAEIFLATQQGHEGFQKPVVLKRILGSIYSDPQFRNMLIDEAHISMSLTHSNIVQVLDLGLAGGRYFLVLELIDGWDLGHVLQRARMAGRPLPRELGVFIVTETCRALAYAHAKRGIDGTPLGIVHRDISPNNVLISEHGEVKLTDFGIAKAMNKREHTGTGVVKGKVAFMSPEQALGKPIDARSDLFSLGTLLYLVTVGVRPFEASTDLETLLRVQRAEFKPPGRVRGDVPAELSRIIARAMKFSPDDRYGSADEMLVDLERVLRALYGGVGQTEVKRYLAELSAADGVPPIGRAQPVLDDGGSSSGAELLEGNAVVLADASDDLAGERTDLAEIGAVDGKSEPRFSRRVNVGGFGPELMDGRETTPGRGLRGGSVGVGVDLGGREMTPSRSTRRVVEELSLGEGEMIEDAPPVRYRRKKSRLPLFLVLAALAGGGYYAARRSGLLPATGETPAAPSGTAAAPAPGTPATPPAPVAAPAAVPSVPAPAGPAPSPTPAVATTPVAPAAAKPAVAPPGPAAVEGRGDKRSAPAPVTEKRPASGGHKRSGSRDVFKESGKRVRSLSQGLDQLPPGTIQLSPPSDAP